MISVLLADDHSLVRTGIKVLINNENDMTVVGESENGEEAINDTLQLNPDVVIMDLSMKKVNGIEATRKIRQVNDEVKIIILSMYDDPEYITQALEAGASTYLHKSNQDQDLIEAIRCIYANREYVTPYMHKSHLEKAGPDIEKLTNREQEILTYIAKGYTNKETAQQLYVSVKTIEAHRANIMGKLNVKSRADLVQYAIKNGLLNIAN